MMKQLLGAVGRWFDARLGFRKSLLPMLTHPVPRAVAGPQGWWYVFGSASVTLLAIQVVTGIGLALVYVPAADKAYESLLYLNNQQPLGGLPIQARRKPEQGETEGNQCQSFGAAAGDPGLGDGERRYRQQRHAPDRQRAGHPLAV